MNNLTAQIFKNKIFNPHKLLAYGFKLEDGFYSFTTQIADGEFRLEIKINESEIFADLYEKDTQDKYTLFLVEGASGSFVGFIRTEYQKVLYEIADNCFDKYVFKSKQSAQIIAYARETYGDELEFLWEKFSDNAVLRRKDNNKWYAVILTVAKNKFGFDSTEKAEVLDLRADPEFIQKAVDNKRFFNGYHMNKKHWITVLLDGSVDVQTIYKMIDDSYLLANKK
ncbi:MAG: MmcQ/YjbR family DNA-binding protein [Clostridia bacterium]|nr:MmcQ/YjbR family DNA-binding protein [Clostridia bacterium]